MAFVSFISLMGMFFYAMLPYLCLFLARPAPRGMSRPLARELLTGTATAMVAFCAVAPVVSRFSFDFYCGLHASLTLAGLLALLFRCRRTPFSWHIPWAPLALIAGAFVIRAVPILWAGHSLGGDDARFHNILAQKILLERMTSATWAPFATVPVLYAQGSHTLVAFLSALTGGPVYEGFNFLFPVTGALTVGMIYLLSVKVFNNSRSGLWSASCYACLPLWGSLDYYGWGGLPNAVAMLFLCVVVWIVLDSVHGDTRQRQFGILGSILCFIAMATTHHHVLMTAFIFLAFGLLFTADSALRRMLFSIMLLSVMACVPLLLAPRLSSGMGAASTDLFTFRETPLTLWDCIRSLNPVLVLTFTVAVLAFRKKSWSAFQLLMLSWFAGLLTAFVFLEYVYRGASLVVSQFHDYFTALTPGRLAADLAYPMCILCGFIPLAPFYESRRRMAMTLLVIAAVTSSTVVWNTQCRTGVFPEFEEAGYWLRSHTPSNSLIIGTFPHIEYLSWRETSLPPLPVSELRKHPDVAWKRRERSASEWISWGSDHHRPLYFVSPPDTPQSPFLREVFCNSSVRIMTTE